MKKLLGILVLGLLLSGCGAGLHPLASKYKPDGFGGGYSEQQVASDRYFVKYRGNGYTGCELVYNRAILRAAELTVELNKDLFAIIHDLDDSETTSGGYMGPSTRCTRKLEIVVENFSDYIDVTNLSKNESKKKFEDWIRSESVTNYYIAEDTVMYFDEYRYQ